MSNYELVTIDDTYPTNSAEFKDPNDMTTTATSLFQSFEIISDTEEMVQKDTTNIPFRSSKGKENTFNLEPYQDYVNSVSAEAEVDQTQSKELQSEEENLLGTENYSKANSMGLETTNTNSLNQEYTDGTSQDKEIAGQEKDYYEDLSDETAVTVHSMEKDLIQHFVTKEEFTTNSDMHKLSSENLLPDTGINVPKMIHTEFDQNIFNLDHLDKKHVNILKMPYANSAYELSYESLLALNGLEDEKSAEVIVFTTEGLMHQDEKMSVEDTEITESEVGQLYANNAFSNKPLSDFDIESKYIQDFSGSSKFWKISMLSALKNYRNISEH